ncbi:hypothetical protein SNL152K_3802 [Streptomyces sp. NL15-2K]|nr:hypothetical protein SNL152K_3802 [Streptomyces sp. NL15-2K]
MKLARSGRGPAAQQESAQRGADLRVLARCGFHGRARSDAVRGQRTPFPAGVRVREDGDSRGLRFAWWHEEDARKQFLGPAQP